MGTPAASPDPAAPFNFVLTFLNVEENDVKNWDDDGDEDDSCEKKTNIGRYSLHARFLCVLGPVKLQSLGTICLPECSLLQG